MSAVDKPLTDLSELVAVADDDLMHVVDVSDLTGSAAGTSYKAQRQNILLPVTSVRRHGGTDGGVLTTAIQDAIDALPATGGIVAVDVVGGTFGAITMDKPGGIRFGYDTFTLTADADAGINVGPDKRVIIGGMGQGLTTLKGSLSGQKIIQYSGLHTDPPFPPSAEKYTAVQDMTLDGDDLAEYAVFSPDVSGSFQWNNGQKVCKRLVVTGFETCGIWTGTSAFFYYFHLVDFSDNAVGLHTGQSADATIFQCQFGQVRSGPLYECLGSQIRLIASSFIGEGDASNLGPDIRFQGVASQGTVVAYGNYHGPENDHADRYKIEFSEVSSATATFADALLHHNWLYGVAGQTAILIDQPLTDVDFSDNIFKTFTRIINDNQAVAASTRGAGRCRFTGNKITSPSETIETKVFENGGRNFSVVEYGPNTTGINVPDRSISGLQNRMRWADGTWPAPGDTYKWSRANGLTLATGQTDSNGGTDAAELTAPGSGGAEALRATIDITSLIDDEGNAASGHNGRVVVRFGAKAGTLSVVDMAIIDSTDGTMALHSIPLTAAWKTQEIVVTGIDPANVNKVYFYPGGSGITAAGTVFLEFVNVSDFGSEFVPTNGTMIDLLGDALAIRTLEDSATPSVVGRDEETFLSGGTTTITDLLGAKVGDVRTILAEHSITITDGTNIFLSGSADFDMVDTDSLTVIQKADGKWYQKSRSVN